MGINGLLQYLKQCYVDKRMNQFAGQTAAVDTYAWLHKIIKGQSGKCLVKGGKQKFKFVKDILRRIQKINNCGVNLVLVFDGGSLPRKRQEQECRKKKREQNLEKAKELLNTGESQEGYKKMAQSVDISPDIAFHLITQIKKLNRPEVKFIIAPYEADAQLAYLNRQGIVDFIITQDSDLLAFGAKRVLYKLDFFTMSGKLIQLDKIKTLPAVSFSWFNHCMFLTTCILCGCDYLNQLPGIGLKKAKQKIARGSTFKSFIQQMQKNSVPEDYQQNFMKAFLTFRFQRVYDPIKKDCVEINQMNFQLNRQKWKQQNSKIQQWSKQVLSEEVLQFVQNNIDNLNFQFLGPKHNKQTAIKIAQGIINPISLLPYKLDNLEYLEYNKMHNGVGQAKNGNSQFNRQSKHNKQKAKYIAQSNQMAMFLKKQTLQKRDFVKLKTNYRPLKMSNQDSQYLSLQSDSEPDSKLQFQSKKGNVQQKKRKLILNQSQEEQQKQSSNTPYESENIYPQIQIKSSSINIMEFQFKNIHTKQNNSQRIIEQVKQTYVEKTIKPQKTIHRISQVNDLLEFTPKVSVQNKQQRIQSIHSKILNVDNQDHSEQLGNKNQGQYESIINLKKSQPKQAWKQKINPFFQIADSIKPMFDQKFFKNPFGTSL